MSETALRAQGLSKHYGSAVGIESIDLIVEGVLNGGLDPFARAGGDELGRAQRARHRHR